MHLRHKFVFFATQRDSGDSLEPFVKHKHFYYFLVSCICFSWPKSTNCFGEILQQLNLSVSIFIPIVLLNFFWLPVNFESKFLPFHDELVFFCCADLCSASVSLCMTFLWINAAVDWRHEIKSTTFPLPISFYE